MLRNAAMPADCILANDEAGLGACLAQQSGGFKGRLAGSNDRDGSNPSAASAGSSYG